MGSKQNPRRNESVRRTRSGEYLAESVAQRLSGPRDATELAHLFRDETACREYLAAVRWPRGFVCPHCGDRSPAQRSERGLWLCPTCDTVSSPATGTLLDRSPLPLCGWFRAVWEVFATDHGANPDSLAKVLGVRRPALVWAWLEQLRTIMAAASAEPLVGLVEVAKVPIELELPGAGNRRTLGHRIVAVAVEARGSELGRVRIRRLERVDGPAMTRFVTETVGRGSTLRTGTWSGYGRLRSSGYGHLVAGGADELYEARMQCMQLMTAMLRIWLRTAPALSLERSDYYLDELVFRLNERGMCLAAERGALFRRIVEVAVTPLTAMPAVARAAV